MLHCRKISVFTPLTTQLTIAIGHNFQDSPYQNQKSNISNLITSDCDLIQPFEMHPSVLKGLYNVAYLLTVALFIVLSF